MNTALLGLQATARFSTSALAAVQRAGLNFVTILGMGYEIGAKDLENNPVRRVRVDDFEIADTVLTNRQRVVLMNKLKKRTTVVTATLPNHQAVVVARGTEKEIKSKGAISYSDLKKAVGEVVSAGHILAAGGFATFDIAPVMRTLRVVTLKHQHLLEQFDGDDQPAVVGGYEASAIAALLGVELPVGEQWEVAAGDLRDPKYLNVEELRRVAHFCEEVFRATEDVKSRKANQYGLYGMLGNVWEWMANPYRLEKSEEEVDVSRELRGGSCYDGPGGVCAAFRRSVDPVYWTHDVGVRLSRPQDS